MVSIIFLCILNEAKSLILNSTCQSASLINVKEFCINLNILDAAQIQKILNPKPKIPTFLMEH